MLESWAGGKRPSNMGMAYWSATHHAPSANQHSDEQSLYLKNLLKNQAGCSLVSAAMSGGKQQIVLRLSEEICMNLR